MSKLDRPGAPAHPPAQGDAPGGEPDSSRQPAQNQPARPAPQAAPQAPPQSASQQNRSENPQPRPQPPAGQARPAGAQPRQQPRPNPGAQPAPQPSPGAQVIAHPASGAPRTASPASPRGRHRLAVLSFALLVALPGLGAVGYLYGIAADQYASRVSFSVRSAETAAPVEFLGALTKSFGGGGPDTEIIYEFVRSQQMVERALATLPLEQIYNQPEEDFIFRLGENRPIEDVVDYWNWMTDISFNSATGIVDFEARAFDPESARSVARLVLDESTELVNELSRKAREDAVSVSREVLTEAENRLRDARRRIRAFRDLEQELDPTENARAALGLVSTLESELARKRVELESQLQLVGARSPRIQVLRQQIASLEKQIADERARLGAGAVTEGMDPERALSDLLAEYEELAVDREFAENAYVSALASYEAAQVEARRQMRYLSPHIEPTLSVAPQYPQRALLALTFFAILLVSWAVLLLVAYNIRDRR